MRIYGYVYIFILIYIRTHRFIYIYIHIYIYKHIYIYIQGESAYDLDGDELGLGDRHHARLDERSIETYSPIYLFI